LRGVSAGTRIVSRVWVAGWLTPTVGVAPGPVASTLWRGLSRSSHTPSFFRVRFIYWRCLVIDGGADTAWIIGGTTRLWSRGLGR